MAEIKYISNSVAAVKRHALFAAGSAIAIFCGWALDVNLIVPVALVFLTLMLRAMHKARDTQDYRLLHLIFLYVIVMVSIYMIRMYRISIF